MINANDWLVKDRRPVVDRHGPHVDDAQSARKGNLAIVDINGVGGVDNATDLRQIVEEGFQVFPVDLPGAGGC